ncbi:MAG: ABC transporter ATP-binding protein [Campylobacterales bacterium]
MAFLHTTNLTRIYQNGEVQTTALDSVTLTIEKGEFIVASGPSGSGKTTLLNLIGGLDRPTRGDVVLEGQKISHMKERQLSKERLTRIGFIFQAYNLIPVLTALENIEYILTLQGVEKSEREARAVKMAKHLGIDHLLHKRPTELSGGQQQRVAVARAVVSEPALILADEPTANLDSKSGEDLMELMRTLNEEKKITFLFSSHDPMVIAKAKRHLYLKDGRIEKDA